MEQLGPIALRVVDRMIADAKEQRLAYRDAGNDARVNGRISVATNSHFIDAAAWAVRQKAFEDVKAAILKEVANAPQEGNVEESPQSEHRG